jgi:kinesin family protein 2/24
MTPLNFTIGKTFTMYGDGKEVQGIYQLVAKDVFKNLANAHSKQLSVFVSFFEMYGGRLFDLLNNRRNLNLLEDKNQNAIVVGLKEVEVKSVEELLRHISIGTKARATGTTSANNESSRSHAIFNIILKVKGEEKGKLTMIDLAGSERGSDTGNANRQARIEGHSVIDESVDKTNSC